MLRPATEPQLIAVGDSGNPNVNDSGTSGSNEQGRAGSMGKGGQGNQERKERGRKRGERNVCIIKNNKRVKNIKYRLTG